MRFKLKAKRLIILPANTINCIKKRGEKAPLLKFHRIYAANNGFFCENKRRANLRAA